MNYREANCPSLHHRKEGQAASSRKYREATEADADGVVFLYSFSGKPPRPRNQRMLRVVFLIARPAPPCGDARRGNSPPRNSFTASMTAPSTGEISECGVPGGDSVDALDLPDIFFGGEL